MLRTYSTWSSGLTLGDFSAGCSVCNEAEELVKRISCSSCDVAVLNMNDQNEAQRARSVGIRSEPSQQGSQLAVNDDS